MGRCLHAGLLWGLEAISWNPDYLSYVVRILAKLARLDPGGRYANRPRKRTLMQIFAGWYPQTNASLSARLQVIDALFKTEPDIAWKLAVDLLPKHQEIVTLINLPRFRDWAADYKQGTTMEDLRKHTVAISERIIKYADSNPPNTWVDLVKCVPELPETMREQALAALGSKASALEKNVKLRIWGELRTIISNNREFSDQKWALPETLVDKIDELYQSLAPEDLKEKYSFLFDSQLPNLTSYQAKMTIEQKTSIIEKERSEAIDALWKEQKSTGIQNLAKTTKVPWLLGNSIAISSHADQLETFVLDWFNDENDSLVKCAMGYASIKQQKTDWIRVIFKAYKLSWNPKAW